MQNPEFLAYFLTFLVIFFVILLLVLPKMFNFYRKSPLIIKQGYTLYLMDKSILFKYIDKHKLIIIGLHLIPPIAISTASINEVAENSDILFIINIPILIFVSILFLLIPFRVHSEEILQIIHNDKLDPKISILGISSFLIIPILYSFIIYFFLSIV